MTPKPPLDFVKVEALRKHMLLTTSDMAELLGVSRMTYYGWVKGKPLRKSNDESVRVMLRKLLTVMTDHGWPMPEVIASDQKQRKARLVEILNS
jgi:DNA-binding XRE family transcriptional regulator